MTYRFIPAHAGNTSEETKPSKQDSVHPRARGEHVTGLYIMLRNFGSSPRTRGTRCEHRRRCECARFIPAHAGNTCGRLRARQARRFIPAHAGNTCKP